MENFPFTQEKKKPDVETRVCEICGVRFVAGYGYSISASWLVTGHAHVMGFSCPVAGQHWGCCPEHAMHALMICLTNKDHMSVHQLLKQHGEMELQGKPRISDDDKELAKMIGDSFPIID